MATHVHTTPVSIPANPITISTEQTMSTREIADLTGKRHDHVMRDTRKMLVELHGEGGVPKFGDTYRNPQNGQEYPIFHLPKRESLILVSGYDLTMRAAIIDRWQILEDRRSPTAMLSDPSSLRALLLENVEKVIALESKVEEMRPAVEALDRISASEGSMTFTQAAKVLGVKRDTMTRWMVVNKWVYRQNGSWVAYQTHIQNGRLEYKEANYTNERTGMKEQKPYCHVTQKGLAKMAQAFATEVQ
ncbi:hypothetical protein GCM10007897_36020 [Sphingobium jiangsuense]|nr:hypothetical protein GCM10007897_36020 [Sphingobium jiangsuense]